jgi:hypothetical protein
MTGILGGERISVAQLVYCPDAGMPRSHLCRHGYAFVDPSLKPICPGLPFLVMMAVKNLQLTPLRVSLAFLLGSASFQTSFSVSFFEGRSKHRPFNLNLVDKRTSRTAALETNPPLPPAARHSGCKESRSHSSSSSLFLFLFFLFFCYLFRFCF